MFCVYAWHDGMLSLKFLSLDLTENHVYVFISTLIK